MSKSLLILGRQPKLGLAELESIFGAATVMPIGEVAATLPIEPEKVDFSRLGGSIKLCRVESELDTSKWPEIQKRLEQLVQALPSMDSDGKIRLGISVYGSVIQPRQILAAGLTIKKILRAQGKSVRLVPNQSSALNSAQVIHNKLTNETGCEIVCARFGNKTIIAKTVAEQDIESYTLRDRGRPKRDARVGMLPPKLAQIIINLAVDGNQNVTILDPFCGTGVILQEGWIMNYDVQGTDLEQRMVDYSIANLDWINNKFNHGGNFGVKVGDATNNTWDNRRDYAIASETYLGQPFSTLPTPEKLEKVRNTCNTIIEKFLLNLARQIKPGVRTCLAVPAWKVAKNREQKTMSKEYSPSSTFYLPLYSFVHLPLIDRLGDLGYNRVRFEHVRDEELLYYREGQIVARELLVLTRK